jgi:hypothetical protein
MAVSAKIGVVLQRQQCRSNSRVHAPSPDFDGPPLGVKQKNSRLAEVVCKNVFGLLVERTPGHDEDSRAPVLIKGSVTLEATIFYNRLGARR